MSRLTRRGLVTAAGAALVAGGGCATAGNGPETVTGGTTGPLTGAGTGGPSGPGQLGIVTPPPPWLLLAAFDVLTRDRTQVAGLLEAWTVTAQRLHTDRPGLSVTVGLGPDLIRVVAQGRAAQVARALELPGFAGDALDPGFCAGDLAVQVCAHDGGAAQQGLRAMASVARPLARLRWLQPGFRDADGTPNPRMLFGFRDGTANLDVADPEQTTGRLWVDDPGGWMHGGTYLVVRRIRLLIDTWERTATAVQERLVGRTRDRDRRLDTSGTSHVELAADGSRQPTMLRRSYSYLAGVDPNGLQDAGLVFLAFMRDPQAQYVPVQRRLAARDPLNAFSQHVGSAVFACPPAPQHAGETLAAGLLR